MSTTPNQAISQKIKLTENHKYADIFIVVFLLLYVLSDLYNQLFSFNYSFIFYVFVLAIAAIGLYIQRNWVKIIAILLIFGFTIIQLYSQNAINRLLSSQKVAIETYQYIVEINSPKQSLADLANSKLGYLVENETVLQSKSDTITFSQKAPYTSALDLANSLLNGELDVIFIPQSQKQLILSLYPDFEKNTKVLDNIKQEIAIEDIAHHVDVLVEPFAILLSGNDIVGDIGQISRSDVNIILVVNPKTYQITTVSVPRDSYLPIPCLNQQYDKLTHTGIKGIQCTIQTLNPLLDIKINYYARVNFSSFLNILHEVGDIVVNSHYDFYGFRGTFFKQGLNLLTPDQALEFVRTRKTVPGGDLTRGVHQQEVIKGIMKKMMSPDILFKIDSIITTVQKSIDTNFPSEALSKLIALQLQENPTWDFNSYAIVGSSGPAPSALAGNQELSMIFLDENSIQEAKNILKATLESDQ